MPETEDIDDALSEFHLTGEQVFKDIQKEIASRKTNSSSVARFTLNDLDDDDDDMNGHTNGNQTASNSRSTRGRGSAASKTTASKVTASKATTSRGRGAARGNSRATANSSTRNGSNTMV